MKVKALVAFRSKISKPCKKLLLFFRLKLQKCIFITSLRRQRTTMSHKTDTQTKKSTNIASIFWPLTRSRKAEKFEELKSVSEVYVERETKHFPSPFTPMKGVKVRSRNQVSCDDAVVNDACRSFENYLMVMMVEEGKLGDLRDVEELLYCWKNLKCPVFRDLVCRFYRELCRDLFSPEDFDSVNL